MQMYKHVYCDKLKNLPVSYLFLNVAIYFHFLILINVCLKYVLWVFSKKKTSHLLRNFYYTSINKFKELMSSIEKKCLH